MIEPIEYMIIKVGDPKEIWFCASKTAANTKLNELVSSNVGTTFAIFKRFKAACNSSIEYRIYED